MTQEDTFYREKTDFNAHREYTSSPITVCDFIGDRIFIGHLCLTLLYFYQTVS